MHRQALWTLPALQRRRLLANNINKDRNVRSQSSAVAPSLRMIVDKALNGQDLNVEETTQLLRTEGVGAELVRTAANDLRRSQTGDSVSYVVNRNINFTNVCVKRCGFCAFSRDARKTQEGYYLPPEEVVRRVKEARSYGATEVCIQAGLPPHMDGDNYVKLCAQVKEAVPEIHVHGFSPEEIWYGSMRRRSTIKEHLQALLAVGLGSLPGTSAEILDQELRNRISPGRIPVKKWLEVVRTAHNLGLRSSSTVMYGHAESSEQLAAHLLLLRDVQKETGGFTEFVPLSFVHEQAPMFRLNFSNLSPGPTWEQRVLVHSVARLAMGRYIPNVQASWVKEGFENATQLLNAGANDLGGTLINESISTSAGAQHGQLARPSRLRALARSQNRTPQERTTLYKVIRRFQDPADDPLDEPLDHISDENAFKQFGSYGELTASKKFRYEYESS
mmetsp:Transcript_1070/g.3336  ORF Transcript_1070/g.3336 Transcript_1070/m.3336 type:complete len:447 (+) Transcript_1070:100-1440(+)|eukprot:CAMPEP_0198730852 /NCGR_PEP_ID=MMETSP1475-20131203/26718_1 /TAXON_ID= ORGANISM="Unidentified sp., Strain CCMP1999" /NCGR_SAMPLE_ID=MMETSP1475 /ASSEMBLY_ACC=CAM_ASM_001111 /LENGTH=446 /DNA_ID=CAMNT_0044493719 /DNA_START=84 /DNA_END=1424 /DNA_ORIENTATION=+